MKAKIENQQIKIYNTLPKIYNGKTGCYPGNFHLQRDEIHRQEGFISVVKPEYNPETQYLGEPYYDEINDIVTYPVNNIIFNLEELRQQRLDEFSVVLDQFALLITRCKLIHGENNTDLNNVIEQTKQMRETTIANINAITSEEEMLAFQIRPEDVRYYQSLFVPYK
jgi:hypothetical protein